MGRREVDESQVAKYIGAMSASRSASESVKGARALVTGGVGNDPRESLSSYLTDFYGRYYDLEFRTSNAKSPNTFTSADLSAIRHLSVSTTNGFDEWLLSPEGQGATEGLLRAIDDSLKLEEIESEEDFTAALGTGTSSVSVLWNLLVTKLRESGQSPRQGIYVVSSKLIAGKRPQLVPMTDSFVRNELCLTWSNCWYRYWQIMRDPIVDEHLGSLRSEVAVMRRDENASGPTGDEVEMLSKTRVLDIIAWHWRWLHRPLVSH
jgi:hypothetical protein